MNHLQYEFGLIPSKIVKEDKAEYIQSLIDAREQETLVPYRDFMVEEHIRNLTREIESFKKSQGSDPINMLSDSINMLSDPINVVSDPITEQLYQAILKDNTLNYAAYADQIGVSEATVKRRLGELKKSGLIIRAGSNKKGHWKIVEHKTNRGV
jgi:predicted HTH transcriptional regulator